MTIATDFIQFALNQNVLRFGEFKTKAGRLSPYFFNAGLFNDGSSLLTLANAYADVLIERRAAGFEFDMLFGPAYKGITLAAATAMALAAKGHNVPYAYNRKEAKDHGEGGHLVGADMAGQRVVIIDDVISAGTSVRESVDIIKAVNATPAAVLIALDRMERSGTDTDIGVHSAVQAVQAEYNLPVYAIASLADLIIYLSQTDSTELTEYREKVTAYRARYGI
ncbi:orotate phosphoribosyltransferase [Formosimonas limnophila]|uniref:Orotate phosphoribosyltransferase n=1 Tax=Formosimonas limnophila TaxID=1384487 RepID=A0A8J3CNC3_9BURK|nr:orotate phosphoribosyltransferase [Formosimonas limnophila]GHA71843.1 orotate phosphoribosyltransferase [Formosimonas limnophila]